MLWRLPDRLLLLIVAEWVLDPFDLSTVSNLALVCRAAADIVASDHVWKRLYERRWPLHAALNVPRVNGGANGANGADKGLVGGGSAGPLSPRSAASGASESAAAASATIASASVVTAGAAASAAAAAPSSAFSARSASTASGVAESSPHRELFKVCCGPLFFHFPLGTARLRPNAKLCRRAICAAACPATRLTRRTATSQAPFYACPAGSSTTRR
jgi:hypothetical protein